jgi:hypothetical protein
MTEIAHATLLNRKEAAEIVALHYGPQLELLTELVNYASNLIPRAYSSSEKQMRDVVVCFALLKQFTSMLDAMDILLRAGAVHAAFVPARVAFEVSLYIEWTLVSDGEAKALHYYVGNIRAERRWGRRAQKGTLEGSDFLAEMGQLGVDIRSNRPTMEQDAAKHVADTERILALPQSKPTNDAFEIYRKKSKRPFEPEWYKVLGKRSIKDIAKELSRLPEYLIYYGKGSEVTHSASYKDHFKFVKQGATASPIRNLADAHTAFNFAFTCALHIFQRVLGFYRNDELRPRH